MSTLQSLQERLIPGKVYRREDLAQWSSAVDRHLKELVQQGDLTKLSGGLYHHPKRTAFGSAPPQAVELVTVFLRDHRFLLSSYNDYNSLGVGTTQLYNEIIVYNHKRHGRFLLAGRMFDFRVRPSFPSTAHKEFLLVDLVNNLDRLAEEKEAILQQVKSVAKQCQRGRLLDAAKQYGLVKTRKFFYSLFEKSTHAA